MTDPGILAVTMHLRGYQHIGKIAVNTASPFSMSEQITRGGKWHILRDDIALDRLDELGVVVPDIRALPDHGGREPVPGSICDHRIKIKL